MKRREYKCPTKRRQFNRKLSLGILVQPGHTRLQIHDLTAVAYLDLVGVELGRHVEVLLRWWMRKNTRPRKVAPFCFRSFEKKERGNGRRRAK